MDHPSRRKISLAVVAAAVLLIAALAAAALVPAARHKLAAPLGPALELPTYTPTSVPKATQQSTPVRQAGTSALTAEPSVIPSASPAAAAVSPTPTPTPEPLCGGPALMYILGIGADNGSDNYQYGLADVIRVARVDFVAPRVTVLSLPRDLWVEIPGISDHYGLTHGKLNQSYLYGGKGMGYYDGPGEGPGLLARTLDLNFGLRVDHYGAVNMYTFVRMIDALGGIDIYLPESVDGTSNDPWIKDMGYFPAGNHHFTGEEALRFSRIRIRSSDFNRADHQTMVLCALKEKLLTPAVLPKIPNIIASFYNSVLTDLSLEQIGQLACLLPHLNSENLLFTSLPKELFKQSQVYSPQMKDNTFILDADYEVIRQYVREFQAGSWPTQSKESSCP